MNTVKQLPNGQFDVQDKDGNSVSHKFGGTFDTREIADGAARMLNLFDAIDERVQQINQTLREARA